MKTTFEASRLVYSTEGGKTCPVCRKAVAACSCAADAASRAVPAAGGTVKVSTQTKGRGGKSVTLVQGLPLDAADLANLAKKLRTACGAGGTVKSGVVEVQGDHAARLVEELQRLGYTVKRAGV